MWWTRNKCLSLKRYWGNPGEISGGTACIIISILQGASPEIIFRISIRIHRYRFRMSMSQILCKEIERMAYRFRTLVIKSIKVKMRPWWVRAWFKGRYRICWSRARASIARAQAWERMLLQISIVSYRGLIKVWLDLACHRLACRPASMGTLLLTSIPIMNRIFSIYKDNLAISNKIK